LNSFGSQNGASPNLTEQEIQEIEDYLKSLEVEEEEVEEEIEGGISDAD